MKKEVLSAAANISLVSKQIHTVPQEEGLDAEIKPLRSTQEDGARG